MSTYRQYKLKVTYHARKNLVDTLFSNTVFMRIWAQQTLEFADEVRAQATRHVVKSLVGRAHHCAVLVAEVVRFAGVPLSTDTTCTVNYDTG